MKIVGTIVNKNMSLIGLLLKGKPLEFGYAIGKDYMMNPFKLDEVKELVKDGKIKDYKINDKGNIEGVNKKLSDLPMYDSKGNFIDKRMEIHSSIEDNGDLVGAVIFFPATGQEKKLKLDDLSMVYEYCEPTNFTLRNRDNSYYITGKGDTKKEDIPVIEKKSMPSSQNKVEKSIVGSEKVVSIKKANIEYIPFEITKDNRHLIGYKGVENEELVIPETFEHDGKYYKVNSIGKEAFNHCTGLTSIVIPDSVTSIGDETFYCCESLTSVDLGNGVTSIGKHAFFDCKNLTSVVIPNSVTSIGDGAFEHCNSLTSVVIPDSVTSIGVAAFADCSGLTSVDLGNGVTSIGECAFYRCYGLTSIDIPDSVTSIPGGAFWGCCKLIIVDIPDSVTSIGKHAFNHCKKLSTIYYKGSKSEWGKIKKGVGWKKDVGSDVSNGCKIVYNYQKEIPYIPFEITKENRHLTGYKGVKNEKLVIPETFEHEGKYYKVNSIGKEAFKNCIDLTSVVISNSITSIGDDAFAHSGLTSIVIPDSVTSIGAGAFVDCTGLTSVDLGNGVTSLGLYAFCDCRGLTSVTIPDSVTSIGKEAFSGCHNLISVDLGNGVTSIGDCAFLYCSGLTSIVIPDSVTTLGKGVFAVCYDLTTIYYKGSKLDWKKNMGSATLKDCKIIYNYKDNI